MSLLKKLFGDYSSKEIKRISKIKDSVLALDEQFSKLTDEELQALLDALVNQIAK